jgi:hypothetical protein
MSVTTLGWLSRDDGSILKRVNLARPGHYHDKRMQNVEHLDGAGMRREHVREASVRHGALVEIGTDELHTAVAGPRIHLMARETALCLFPPEHAPRAMHRRVESRPRLVALDTLQDDSIIAHGTADKSLLTRERWRCALAYDP